MIKKSKLLSAVAIATASFIAAPSYADTMNTPDISAMSVMNGLENPWDMASLMVVTCLLQKNVKVYL